MKEYKCVKIGFEVPDTEKMLNELALEGWKLICSYALEYLILERERKNGN